MNKFSSFSRELKLWKATFVSWSESLKTRWEQYSCPHDFRPARIKDKPGRVCKICDKAETLSPEIFFALFGERNWRR